MSTHPEPDPNTTDPWVWGESGEFPLNCELWDGCRDTGAPFSRLSLWNSLMVLRISVSSLPIGKVVWREKSILKLDSEVKLQNRNQSEALRYLNPTQTWLSPKLFCVCTCQVPTGNVRYVSVSSFVSLTKNCSLCGETMMMMWHHNAVTVAVLNIPLSKFSLLSLFQSLAWEH